MLNALIHSWNNSNVSLPAIVELGQTFFSFIEKFNLVQNLSIAHLNLNYNVENLQWIGIDNSEFCNTTAQILHGSYNQNIKIYKDWKSFQKEEYAIFHSRFVCSYAFQSTATLADYICENFDCALIEDAFSVTDNEEITHNHGQKELFFNINLFNQLLFNNNFETYILDYYGDWPAGSNQCLVVKMLIIKTGSINQEKFKSFLIPFIKNKL